MINLCVHQFGGDFPRMAGWVVMVGVFSDFLLCPLFSAVAGVNMLVEFVVVMLVLVEVCFGHLKLVDFTKNVHDSLINRLEFCICCSCAEQLT